MGYILSLPLSVDRWLILYTKFQDSKKATTKNQSTSNEGEITVILLYISIT